MQCFASLLSFHAWLLALSGGLDEGMSEKQNAKLLKAASSQSSTNPGQFTDKRWQRKAVPRLVILSPFARYWLLASSHWLNRATRAAKDCAAPSSIIPAICSILGQTK